MKKLVTILALLFTLSLVISAIGCAGDSRPFRVVSDCLSAYWSGNATKALSYVADEKREEALRFLQHAYGQPDSCPSTQIEGNTTVRDKEAWVKLEVSIFCYYNELLYLPVICLPQQPCPTPIPILEPKSLKVQQSFKLVRQENEWVIIDFSNIEK